MPHSPHTFCSFGPPLQPLPEPGEVSSSQFGVADRSSLM